MKMVAKAAKKRAKMNTKKSDIEYSAIFNTKDNTSSNGGKSNSKPKPPYFYKFLRNRYKIYPDFTK